MDQIVTLGMLFGLILLIFFFCREVVMWYFKINRRIELQEETLEQLKKLNGEAGDSNFQKISNL